ncbi:MAG TPA: hypothetical protein VFI72_14380 [Candidatus Angelobacter sp.]|nr:hypothetical protein [Candidatus Angelobacter sp.]
MKIRFALALAAMGCFLAVPVFAQHGGHGGGDHSGSMHGDMHSSGHDHDNDANEHSGKSGHDHGRSSISAKLASNTKLASKLQALLPPGTNLQTAAQGFKNLGQFVAAVHVSKNLGIPFDQLKAAMIGPPAQSLGKAIQQLQPSTNAKAAVKTAEKQAKADLRSSDTDNDGDKDADAGHKHDTAALHDADKDDTGK